MSRILFMFSFIFAFAFMTLGHTQPVKTNLRYRLVESVSLPESATIARIFEKADGKSEILIADNKIMLWLNSNKPKIIIPDGYLKTVFSKNSRFFVMMNLSHDLQNDEMRELTLEVYSRETGRLYTVRQSKHFDDAIPLIEVSGADGSLILGHNFSGRIFFFDNSGELINQIDLFPGADYDLERPLAFSLNMTGSRLAVVAGKRGASPLNSNAIIPSSEPYLYLFTAKGENLWRKALPELSTSNVKISDNGQYVVANAYTVDVQGNVKKRSLVYKNEQEILDSDFLFKRAEFSSNGNYLVLAENHEASLFDLTTGKALWREKTKPETGLITAATVSEDADAAVLLIAKNEFKNGSFLYSKPILRILDKSGVVRQEIMLNEQFFKKPALRLSPDANELSVGFTGNYQIYQVEK